MAAARAHNKRQVRQVWTWNLDKEFNALLATVVASGSATLIAMDTEFPGFLRERPDFAPLAEKYDALRCNVDIFRPIQLGLAVVGADKTVLGAWCFNLHFDLAVDLHTEASVEFLCRAGIIFPRHATEGICALSLGQRLAASALVGSDTVGWVTFAGIYDFGYLMKLLTGKALPADKATFDNALTTFCPRQYELRDWLPYGSLESLVQQYGVQRHGAAHTAGSDALATAELFLRAAPPCHFAGSTTLVSVEEPPVKMIAETHASVPPQRHMPCNGSAQRACPVAPTADIGSKASPANFWGAAAREAALQARATAASGRVSSATYFAGNNIVEVS